MGYPYNIGSGGGIHMDVSSTFVCLGFQKAQMLLPRTGHRGNHG